MYEAFLFLEVISEKHCLSAQFYHSSFCGFFFFSIYCFLSWVILVTGDAAAEETEKGSESHWTHEAGGQTDGDQLSPTVMCNV